MDVKKVKYFAKIKGHRLEILNELNNLRNNWLT